MRDRQIGLFDRGVDPVTGQPKRHRRIVQRDRRWHCRLHRISPQGWTDAFGSAYADFLRV